MTLIQYAAHLSQIFRPHVFSRLCSGSSKIPSILLGKDSIKLVSNIAQTTTEREMNAADKQTNLIRTIWRQADAVCFDVDSTVCRDEAIDELAAFANKDKEVAQLTKQAMKGGCSFRDALAQRLDLIQPTQQMMKDYLKLHPPRLTPGITDLMNTLHSRDVDVYLVSGGFATIIEPVARELGIPVKNIFANRIKFYFDGTYAGFDEDQPTSMQDGKAQVVAYLKHRYGYRRVVMVGDGATDLEAAPPADAFIGFGGNQIRDKVKKEAKWFVMSFYDLIEELNRN